VEIFFFTRGQLKKLKNEKNRNQCHVSEFAELDGEGGILEKKTLRGCKSNQKFYRGENQK